MLRDGKLCIPNGNLVGPATDVWALKKEQLTRLPLDSHHPCGFAECVHTKSRVLEGGDPAMVL